MQLLAVIASARRDLAPEELTNFLLGPDYAKWLVGPIARIASEEEIAAYLAIGEDSRAEEFIEAFWRQRGSEGPWPSGPRAIFRQRSAEADRLFGEATLSGSHTDRGTIFILYGAPKEVRYESSTMPNAPPVETWVYAKGAERGLDDKRPQRLYRFSRQGDVVRFYRGPVRRELRGVR